MIKKKSPNRFIFDKLLLKNQRGQADIIGNVLHILEKQPWILLILFLAGVYFTTFKISILGIDFSPSGLLNALLTPVFGIFHFQFDWRLIVVIIFLTIPVGFIVKYGYKK